MVGIRPTKRADLTGNKPLDSLSGQIRINCSALWGELLRKINPSAPLSCRFCGDSPPPSHSDEGNGHIRRGPGRCNDPVKCPYCPMVLASRHSCVGHLKAIHKLDHLTARKLLERAPPAPPREPDDIIQCPYCPRTGTSIPGINKHISLLHSEQARVKKPRPPPRPVEQHQCDICNFTSTTKSGLTTHLLSSHHLDRRQPKRHRSNDCDESTFHLLFDCPRLQSLRIKHGISPPDGTSKPWFHQRFADFIIDALLILPDLGYECKLSDTSSTSSLTIARKIHQYKLKQREHHLIHHISPIKSGIVSRKMASSSINTINNTSTKHFDNHHNNSNKFNSATSAVKFTPNSRKRKNR